MNECHGVDFYLTYLSLLTDIQWSLVYSKRAGVISRSRVIVTWRDCRISLICCKFFIFKLGILSIYVGMTFLTADLWCDLFKKETTLVSGYFSNYILFLLIRFLQLNTTSLSFLITKLGIFINIIRAFFFLFFADNIKLLCTHFQAWSIYLLFLFDYRFFNFFIMFSNHLSTSKCKNDTFVITW